MTNYCRYCAAHNKGNSSSRFLCGTFSLLGRTFRSRQCLIGEINILRAEKEHAFQQAYDLEWQRNLYARIVEVLKAQRKGEAAEYEVDAALATLADLSIPFKDRKDELTREFLAQCQKRRERLAG